MKESWEKIWAEKRSSGAVSQLGKKLAARSDLQFLVFRELKEWCNLKAGSRVLEVGCGTAPVPAMLRKTTEEIYGVDVSFSSVRTSSLYCKAVVGDGRNLPFPDCSFDAVFSTGVLDLYDLNVAGRFIEEMERVLEHGGRAVVITSSRGCRLHQAVMDYLKKRGRWKYGPKKSFSSLAHAVSPGMTIVKEHGRGAVFQLRFISYLFEDITFARRLYNAVFLCLSLVFRPLNRLPGAILVTVMEKI